MDFEFDAELWVWQVRAGNWTFVSLPPEVADEVLDLAAPFARGFGSVRVEVTIGATVWRTSIFPSSSDKTYVLPIKQAVRQAESLAVGDSVSLRLSLVDVPPAD